MLASQKVDDLDNTEVDLTMDVEQLSLIIARGQQRMDEKEINYKIAGIQFNVSQQVAQMSRLVQWGKGLVDEAVKVSPEASMAWCAISLILPLLTASADTAKVHRDGFYHVTARMKFYVALEALLFPRSQPPSEAVPRDSVVTLYKSILEFQFSSVLRYFRGRLRTLGRDLISHDDWNGMLQNIQKIEDEIHRDLNTVGSASIREKLSTLDEITKQSLRQNDKLLQTAAEHLRISTEQSTTLQKTLELQQHERYKLPTVVDAIYGSDDVCKDPECYNETRRAIRTRILGWINGDDKCNMIWLNGHAGTGKSTIARTLAKHLETDGKLAASYFFKRGDQARNSTRRVIPTISTQLMASVPGFRTQLWASLKTEELNEVEKIDSTVQFRNLIYKPLEALAKETRSLANTGVHHVILFDAMDECNNQKDLFRIIELLFSLKNFEMFHFRVFATSRPTPIIDSYFKDLKQSMGRFKIPCYSLSLLDPDFYEETVVDIEIYLKESFASIKTENRHLKDAIWPVNEEIEKTVSLSTRPYPLFVYASTLVRYINGRGINPASRLTDWLERSDTNSEQLDEKLDEMYQIVLDQAWSSRAEGGPGLIDREKALLVDMLRSLVLLASPLSSDHLLTLLSISRENSCLLENLSAVISVPNNDTAPVEIIHKSFSDFLLRQKPGDIHGFQMSVSETHAMLASRCFERMQNTKIGLKRDICDLRDFGKGANEVDEYVLNSAIPSDLRYACLFWVHHLQKLRDDVIGSGNDEPLLASVSDLLENVEAFLRQHYLHWLEALSLLKCISDGIVAMGALFDLLKVSPYIL